MDGHHNWYLAGVATAVAAFVSPGASPTAWLLIVACTLGVLGLLAGWAADRKEWKAEVRRFRGHLTAFAAGLDNVFVPSGKPPAPQDWRQLAERLRWPCLPAGTSLRASRQQADLWQREEQQAALHVAETIYPLGSPPSRPDNVEFHHARQQLKMICEDWGERSALGFWGYLNRVIVRKRWAPILVMLAYVEIALASRTRSSIPPQDDGLFRLGNRLFGCDSLARATYPRTPLR